MIPQTFHFFGKHLSECGAMLGCDRGVFTGVKDGSYLKPFAIKRKRMCSIQRLLSSQFQNNLAPTVC